ncbi:MAG: hypothetical protein NXI18_08920 [Alphaproteobacteria bacterium]|nr:hypothetical protein [Alphaproteobacteria bacterium]
MNIIKNIKLTDIKRSNMIASPQARLRHKLMSAIEEQAAVLKADMDGEPFTKRALRSFVDPQTGERIRKEVPVRVRRWFWVDGTNGKCFLQIRYGNKPLELAKGKATIEVANTNELLKVMDQLRTAVADGELDDVLQKAAFNRRRLFERR